MIPKVGDLVEITVTSQGLEFQGTITAVEPPDHILVSLHKARLPGATWQTLPPQFYGRNERLLASLARWAPST